MILCVTVYFYTKRMAATTAHKKVLASFKNKKTQESLFKSKGKSAEGVRSTQNAVNLSGKRMEERVMFTQINNFITWFDGVVWGLPLIILILFTGILLTTRLGLLQVRHLGKALKFMVKNEEGGDGEVTSFGALCTALSATIGTGNIVGVATAIAAGGPGALFWMIVAAFFGMATKYAEGLLAIKYRTIDKEGHVLGGPFYYIENGMGKQWRWLAKIFAFFGAGVGLFGIGTFTQVNGISSAVTNFFDPDKAHTVALFGNTYSWATVVACLILTVCVGLVVLGGIQRIAKVSQVVVPFMAVAYLCCTGTDHCDHKHHCSTCSDRNYRKICFHRKRTCRWRNRNHGRSYAEGYRPRYLLQ